MQPIQFYSCSIIHSSKGQAFADRLHSRMVQEKLRIWYAREDMLGGIWPRSTGGRPSAGDSLQFGAARFGVIDRRIGEPPCARRGRRTHACKRRERRLPAGWSAQTLHDLPSVPFASTLQPPGQHRLALLASISRENFKGQMKKPIRLVILKVVPPSPPASIRSPE
jgi:hypothetical protein